MIARLATTMPGNTVVRGPLSRYIHSVWALGGALESDQNLRSPHIWTSILR